MTGSEAGAAGSVKCGGGCSSSVTVAVWVSVPLVPVIVRVAGPSGVVDGVATVSVAAPAPAMDDGAKDRKSVVEGKRAVDGREPVNPFRAVVDTVEVVLAL